jgi:DNA-binding transcriptional MerR regulator/methylmalonyl-CoA mutase cobalamin-binding subunit
MLIADVERVTGVARATLRVWERRYNFPTPARNSGGERVYRAHEVEKLRLVQQLTERGRRPGGLMALTLPQLQQLVDAGSTPSPAPKPLQSWLDLLRRHDTAALCAHLRRELTLSGVHRFSTELLAPLAREVGDAWQRGELHVYEEHLFVQAVQLVLGELIVGLSSGPAPGPRVLLATLSGELHGLGLMMVQAVLAAERCGCASLGVSMPVGEVAQAAEEIGCDIVALSFSASMNPARAARDIATLRERLPSRVELWVGGSCSALRRLRLDGVRTFDGLDAIAPAVADYRAARD